jgi:hypothetical protein
METLIGSPLSTELNIEEPSELQHALDPFSMSQ